MEIIKEISDEVLDAIDSSFKTMAEKHYTEYILYIGRADIVPGLKQIVGTDCVIDYHLDYYYDKTRKEFYLHYLRRNYSTDGFKYDGESGIDDLSIEMMIYSHLWDSIYFLKSLYRLAAILDNKGYQWNPMLPENGKYTFIRDNIIKPMQTRNIRLGDIVSKAYDSNIRNAFAHSLYSVDVESRRIFTRTKQGNREYSFEEFQTKFLYSVFLIDLLNITTELNHNNAGMINDILTPEFLTPDGIKVQVHGKIINRAGKFYPELRLYKTE